MRAPRSRRAQPRAAAAAAREGRHDVTARPRRPMRHESSHVGALAAPPPPSGMHHVYMSSSTPAPERAYRHLKSRILSGELPGGEMTSEGAVAAELGMSRTPVREALMRLQAESLMRIFPKRGAQVVPVAPGEADDVFEARALIESHAALRWIQHGGVQGGAHAGAELLTELEHSLEAQQQAVDAGDLETYSRLDTAFHHTIIAAGGNALLTSVSESLRERQQRLTARGARGRREGAAAFVAGHRRLLEHLRSGDAEGYAAELREHLDSARAGAA